MKRKSPIKTALALLLCVPFLYPFVFALFVAVKTPAGVLRPSGRRSALVHAGELLERMVRRADSGAECSTR